jgi:CSLREA domain-containing protein
VHGCEQQTGPLAEIGYRAGRRLLLSALLAALLATTAALASAATSSASDFPVTKEADTNDGTCDSDCSLREAVDAANKASSDDVIAVPPGHYFLTLGQLEVEPNGTFAINGTDARTTIIDGNGVSRVIEISGVASISGVTITGGNQVAQGGGIFNGGTLTLTNVAVVGNTAISEAGALFGGQGGGIFNNNELIANESLVAGNHADANGATNAGAQGGGIFNNDVAHLTNVTISGNDVDAGAKASARGQGGGIFQNESGTTLTNVTIANNQADLGGSGATGEGGGIFINDGTAFKDTLIAGNLIGALASNCTINSEGLTGDHNLESGTDCGFTGAGDKQNANPLLGALLNNGGQTDTLALGAGSPAIDAGAACASVDQRGVSRPQGPACDIGAFEAQVFTPPIEPAPNGADLALTMTVSPATIVQGGRTALTATVHNAGPTPAGGVSLKLALPAGATLSSSGNAVISSAGPCAATTCTIGTLASGGSATVTVPVKLTKTGAFTIAGDASSATSDPVAANNHASANVFVTKLSAASVLALPSAHRCLSKRRFRITLRRPNGIVIARATVSVNGKRVKTVKGRQVSSVIDLRGLPKGTIRVKITVVTDTGLKLTGTRTYHTCHKRLRGHKHLL